MRTVTLFLIAGAAVASAGAASTAGPLPFFGEDLNPNPRPSVNAVTNNDNTRIPVASRVNANAARNAFYAAGALASKVLSTISFEVGEGYQANTTVPVPPFPVDGVGVNSSNPRLAFPGTTVNGTTTNAIVRFEPAGTSAGPLPPVSADPGGEGRYPSSGEQYLEASTSNFVINFDETITAAGFFGIDVGDFGGRLRLRFSNSGANPVVMDVAHTLGTTFPMGGDPEESSTSGSIFFFGLIVDPTMAFNRIEFFNTFGGNVVDSRDVFAFDELVIGVPVIPLPNALGLGMAGLAGLAGLSASRRRRLA